jgi:hypothetical protein
MHDITLNNQTQKTWEMLRTLYLKVKSEITLMKSAS